MIASDSIDRRGKELLPTSPGVRMAVIDAQATRLATILQNDLDALAHDRQIFACTRRRSTKTSALASAVTAHLFPDDISEPLRALIRYEMAIIKLRAAFLAQAISERVSELSTSHSVAASHIVLSFV